jgi:hypothetical protein
MAGRLAAHYQALAITLQAQPTAAGADHALWNAYV